MPLDKGNVRSSDCAVIEHVWYQLTHYHWRKMTSEAKMIWGCVHHHLYSAQSWGDQVSNRTSLVLECWLLLPRIRLGLEDGGSYLIEHGPLVCTLDRTTLQHMKAMFGPMGARCVQLADTLWDMAVYSYLVEKYIQGDPRCSLTIQYESGPEENPSIFQLLPKEHVYTIHTTDTMCSSSDV